jgi:predicted nucleic acid-binding protein
LKAHTQFWDTSALVALIFQEPHSTTALRARNDARRYHAWEWIQLEAVSALRRRGATAAQKQTLRTLLTHFQYVVVDSSDTVAIGKLIEKHGLRAADAGHLFCLIQAKKLHSNVHFVCFDRELTAAAESEGIRVYSPSS